MKSYRNVTPCANKVKKRLQEYDPMREWTDVPMREWITGMERLQECDPTSEWMNVKERVIGM